MSDRRKIIVGLSGGVDSSVTALRLLEQGHEVEGLFMKNWEDDDSSTECTAETDLEDAKQVCRELGIPLHQANFAKAYKDEVFSYCLREYQAGRTPNPDILCNQRIKFRAFLDYALRLGADYVATGHYARIDHKDGKFRLLTGLDDNKDQTYFLYTLGQEQLARALFPIGDMEKPKVREMAEMAGFDNFAKKDSTGICFIGERDFRAFLNRYIASNPGPIQTPEGETIGEHMGLSFYTLGQRRGLDIGGVAGYPDGAWYVAEKDMDSNILIAVQGHDHPLLLSIGLEASNLSWVSGSAPEGEVECQAKTRYRQSAQRCRLHVTGEDTVEVVFDEPQRAVTPGQSVVFYQDQVCLGGGIINRRWS